MRSWPFSAQNPSMAPSSYSEKPKSFQGLQDPPRFRWPLSSLHTPLHLHWPPCSFYKVPSLFTPQHPFRWCPGILKGPPWLPLSRVTLVRLVTFPETNIPEHCNPLSTPYCLLLPSSCSIALTIFQNNMQVAYLFIGLLPIKTRPSCSQRSLSLGFTERAWHILCIEWVSVE